MKKRIPFSPSFNNLTLREESLVEEACAAVQKFVKSSSKLNSEKFRTRDAHAKSYGVVHGNFEITAQDEIVNQIFTQKNYKAILRVSNAKMMNEEGKDKIPAYGLAIKVMNVADGLDFNLPLVNFPMFPANSVSKFLKTFIAANKYMTATASFGVLGVVKLPSLLLKGVSFLPNLIDLPLIKNSVSLGLNSSKNPLFFNYHSVAAYRFGNYMVKFMAKPILENSVNTELEEKSQREAVQEVFKSKKMVYSLKMQYCTKEEWINDLTKIWPRKKFKEIGKITIDPNSILNPFKTEKLSFSPFESPENLKPVGRLQKTREKVYSASVAARRS